MGADNAWLRFVFPPVERDCPLVEHAPFAKGGGVAPVPLRRAELPEVERGGAEAEFMGNLLVADLCPVRRADLDRHVRLSVRLYVGINPRLLLFIPDSPVLLVHHRTVYLELRGGRRRHEDGGRKRGEDWI